MNCCGRVLWKYFVGTEFRIGEDTRNVFREKVIIPEVLYIIVVYYYIYYIFIYIMYYISGIKY